ncbi:hypothetical protein V2J09_014666 [Rumex salicifolius]
MFEGVVKQLLLGYLGRYIKDFNKEQLKITLWNEEVLFENVELILEAFDYLQLPFALKEGRVGRLCIKIPWKKLGWDPIIILLEDVFFCAGERDDEEWCPDAVEKRELAAKKAKLAAAELAKLSRRVCDNQAGQSFISHIAGRILDNIQVSIKNFHIQYCKIQPDLMQMLFGLTFKSVMVTRHNLGQKTRSGQVSKMVEIHGMGVYCTTFTGSLDLVSIDAAGVSQLGSRTGIQEDQYVLIPFDASLLVIKSGIEGDAPQYCVTAELTKLVMSVDTSQLHHILAISDTICICQLREKYGRYRPFGRMSSRKGKGWVKAWWHYAQEAVLSDVRKRLKKFSWRYFAERLDSRHKYVKLYKIKLNFLQKEQPVDVDVREELQKMEKDFDIDDILKFRSIAELQLEESTLNSTDADFLTEGPNVAAERSQHDDIIPFKTRGWLNWLSRGVLGAGGTDDSTQFSGVVSEAVIKDICEATKFQPMSANDDDDESAIAINFLAVVKISINQVSLSLRTMKLGAEVAKLNLQDFMVECKVWEDSATIVTMIGSINILNSCEKISILQIEKAATEKNKLDINEPSITLQVDILPKAQEAELSVKIMLQPLEIDFNYEFFSNLLEFYSVLESVSLQQDQIFKLLNGISDIRSRISSKAECLCLSRRRVIWDLNFSNISMRIPSSTLDMLACSLLIRAAAFRISSCYDIKSVTKKLLSKSAISDRCLKTDVNGISGFQLEELYDYYEVNLNDLEILSILPGFPQGISIIEKACVSVSLAHCIIPEETILKQLQAQILIQSLHVHIAPSICGAIVRITEDLHLFLSEHKKRLDIGSGSSGLVSSSLSIPFCFSLTANIDLITLDINLEDNGDASSCVVLSMQQLQTQLFQPDLRESSVSVNKVKIVSYRLGSENNILILCSSGLSSSDRKGTAVVDDCFVFSHQGHETQLSFSLCLNDIELHCYPKIIGLLVDFCDGLYGDGNEQHSDRSKESRSSGDAQALGFQKFGFSNFHDKGFSQCDGIPLCQFPFVRMYNSGSGEPSVPLCSRSFTSMDKHASRFSDAPHSESSETASLGYSIDHFLFTTKFQLRSIKLHFHDASSIVGSVTLPVGEVILGSHENTIEVLCSVDGLTISSPWWVRNNQELLWAPLVGNKSPILNLHFRTSPSLSHAAELRISVQNVRCILPPEYLAILIGYFTLPDWAGVQSKQKTDFELQVAPNEKRIIYKFEILESSLISPIEGDDNCFLRLEIPELFGSFILNDSSENALSNIIPECLVPEDKFAVRINSLNIYGHNLTLSLLVCNNNVYNSFAFDEIASTVICKLIQSLNVELWIIIPRESLSVLLSGPSRTRVMAYIASCEFVAEDCYVTAGLQGLSDVIEKYSLVGKEAKYFTHDIQQFLQLKKALKGSHVQPVELSSDILTEVRCYAGFICIKLQRSNTESKVKEVIARMDAAFLLSASLINDTVISLDANFSSLSVVSLDNSVTLVNCLPEGSASSVLGVHMTTSNQNHMELGVTLPSINLWLYLTDWFLVVDLLDSYFRLSPSAEDAGAVLHDQTIAKCYVSAESDSVSTKPENVVPNNISLSLRSENMGISVHIPVWYGEEICTETKALVREQETTNNCSLLPEGPKECKFVMVSLQSRSFDLFLDGSSIKFRSTFGKTTGFVGIRESGVSRSWPFFKLFQLSVDFEVFDYTIIPAHIKADLHCEIFDVWLSHQVLYFWNGLEFDNSKANKNAYDFGRVDINFQLSKASLLLTDGRWSCNGPLVELILRNLYLETIIEEKSLQVSASSNLNINYNNIHKVLWEPFVEPWAFQISILRKHDKSGLLGNGIIVDVQLKSTTELNLNFTESLIEVIFRATEMVKDAQGLIQSDMNGQGLQNYQHLESFCARRYAPYVINNMTSLPLVFRIHHGLMLGEGVNVSTLKEETTVPSGLPVPIYLDDELEGEAFNYRPNHSSDGLKKQQSNSAGHHFMTIQFEGTAEPSDPISMDLVGLTYFEVDFSKGHSKGDVNGRLLVPVVFDVSVQRGTKLIQLYSTVILMNSTSTPLELRFDIPFGISPKIVDPIYPGQEFPLPLHLAEAGRISWRPLSNKYLWSESHNLSNILSYEGRSGFLRSLVCYPSNPSSDPFRCCLSVQDICLPFLHRPKIRSAQTTKGTSKQFIESDNRFCNLEQSRSRFIHRVILNTPLMVKNYLPEAVSMTVESGGISRSIPLAEVETSVFHIDSSHDLRMTFNIDGFKPSTINFPRSETFGTMAKSCGTFLSLTETMSIDSFSSVEKMMDTSSGARELCLSVPFLLYNCTGFPLDISSTEQELKGACLRIPSCYNSSEQFILQRDGLGLLSSESSSLLSSSRFVSQTGTLSLGLSPKDSSTGCTSVRNSPSLIQCDLDADRSFINGEDNNKGSNTISGNDISEVAKFEPANAKPVMYSPYPNIPASEIMVRLSRNLPELSVKNPPNNSWSAPFFLVAPSASTTVLVPQPFSTSATVVSVTSTLLDIPLSGRTRAICFQPRYVISNACGKKLCYKQKGSDYVFQLGVGTHSHLLWPDTRRELLVSVRFDDPGWQWSGCFSPDHPGDQQVKMRNYLSGASYMIRVEVQSADDIGQDETMGNTFSNSGTNFILLSDDDTGFMPYRIDNFSKETLRVYQQKCETLETIVHPYTSCLYSWDEPCYPHRLIVEVPGERIIGSYTMDDVQQYSPVHLKSSAERHERTLVSSVHAEGAMKVLSIVDSSCHVLEDLVDANSSAYVEKRKQNGGENLVDCKDRIIVTLSSVGISLINSFPQEILFACAKDVELDLSQTVKQQMLSFKISSLQVDNQSRSTQYPVSLSFDQEHGGILSGYTKYEDQDDGSRNESLVQFTSARSCEPVIWISAAKWRNKDARLVSFESVNIRIANFHLEFDQELLLSLLDFYRAVVSVQRMDATFMHPEINGHEPKMTSVHALQNLKFLQSSENLHLLRVDNFSLRYYRNKPSLPEVIPIGAPWQKIYLFARTHNKIYVEAFSVAPTKITLSFSSNPWTLKSGALRGLMALADVEGATINLRKLSITHHIASWESIQEIVSKHYTKQFLHEMFKVFGSAGVIGNPMGFARRVGHGIKDFLFVPAKGVLESPTGLITGMAHGTTSLVSNTLYAFSDAATQFSKAAHKGILAFTFDHQEVSPAEKQQIAGFSHSKGVISEVLEGLTGLLQSPIRGAEKHGFALGVTGLVARPAASVLEATGKTAQSIRNRSKLHRMGHHPFRTRLPRPLSRETALRPYSWEEAVGAAVLTEANAFEDDHVLVMCKSLNEPGKFVVLTERLITTVKCLCLADLGKPEFRGISINPEWVVEVRIGLESVIHADNNGSAVNIVGSSSQSLAKRNPQQERRAQRWSGFPTPLPLFQTTLELRSKEEAQYFLLVLMSTIEQGKERGWGKVHLLHQSNQHLVVVIEA